jgi:hypothetical protein
VKERKSNRADTAAAAAEQKMKGRRGLFTCLLYSFERMCLGEE